MNSSLFIILLVLSIAVPNLSHGISQKYSEHVAVRNQIEKLQGNSLITKDHIRRRIQSVQNTSQKWRRMKIFFDLTGTHNENPSAKAFYTKVYQIVGEWWEQAVWIKDERALATQTIQEQLRAGNIPRFNFPRGKHVRDYDLLVHTHMAPTDGGTLAWAGPLYRHPTNDRPITGEAAVVWFGHRNFMKSRDHVNAAVATIVHEFGHVMYFISLKDYHPHYVRWSDVQNTFLWTGPEARNRGNLFYKCPKSDELKGLPLQTMRPRIEEGAHFQENFFDDELMTPFSGTEAEKVSPMMFGLMEDTLWYKADYSKVELYAHQIGQSSKCVERKACPTNCCKIGTENFVTSDYRGMGYCDPDDNGCPKEFKYSNRDCSMPDAWDKKYLSYGASYSKKSILVEGTFLKWDSDGQSYNQVNVLSVQAFCDSTDFKQYFMRFNNFKLNRESFEHKGEIVVKCEAEGQKKFNCLDDYCSEVKCYNPQELCKAISGHIALMKNDEIKKCHVSCTNNGRCRTENFLPSRVNRRMINSEELFASYKNKKTALRRRLIDSLNKNSISALASSNNKNHINRKSKNGKDEKSVNVIKPIRNLVGNNGQNMENQDLQDSRIVNHLVSSRDDIALKCWCYTDFKEHVVCPDIEGTY